MGGLLLREIHEKHLYSISIPEQINNYSVDSDYMGKIKNSGRIREGYYYHTKENCIVTISKDDGDILLTRQNEEDPYKKSFQQKNFH